MQNEAQIASASEHDLKLIETARSLTDNVNESFMCFVTVTVSFFRRESVSSFCE